MNKIIGQYLKFLNLPANILTVFQNTSRGNINIVETHKNLLFKITKVDI